MSRCTVVTATTIALVLLSVSSFNQDKCGKNFCSVWGDGELFRIYLAVFAQLFVPLKHRPWKIYNADPNYSLKCFLFLLPNDFFFTPKWPDTSFLWTLWPCLVAVKVFKVMPCICVLGLMLMFVLLTVLGQLVDSDFSWPLHPIQQFWAVPSFFTLLHVEWVILGTLLPESHTVSVMFTLHITLITHLRIINLRVHGIVCMCSFNTVPNFRD